MKANNKPQATNFEYNAEYEESLLSAMLLTSTFSQKLYDELFQIAYQGVWRKWSDNQPVGAIFKAQEDMLRSTDDKNIDLFWDVLDKTDEVINTICNISEELKEKFTFRLDTVDFEHSDELDISDSEDDYWNSEENEMPCKPIRINRNKRNLLGPFRYGLAGFSKKDGKGVGFINTAGEEVIECGRFCNTVESFNRFGFALVQDTNGYQGIIDRSGAYVVEPRYRYIKFMENSPLVGVAMNNSEDWAVINPKDGNKILGVFSEIGSPAWARRCDLIGVTPEWNNNILLPVCNDDKWGVMDEKGKITIPLIYDRIYLHNNGMCENDFIGDYVVARAEAYYDDEDPFDFYEKGKCGLLTKEGDVVLDFIYDELYYFSDDCIVIGCEKRGGLKYGVITLAQEVVIPCQYDDIYVGDGVISVKKGLWWGWADMNGKMLVKPRFYVKEGNLEFSEGLARVNDPYNEKQGFVNKTGELVIPCVLSPSAKISKFANGLAYYIKSRNRRGWIDRNGNFAITPIYENYSDFSEDGLVPVSLNGEGFYIDRTGARCLF